MESAKFRMLEKSAGQMTQFLQQGNDIFKRTGVMNEKTLKTHIKKCKV